MSFDRTAADILAISADVRRIELPDDEARLEELLARRQALLERLDREYRALTAAEVDDARAKISALRHDDQQLQRNFREVLAAIGEDLQQTRRRRNMDNGMSEAQCLDRRA